MPNLVSELVIRLKNELSGTAREAAADLRGIDRAAKEAGQGASRQLDSLREALKKAQDQANRVDLFNKARERLPALRQAFNDAKAKVEELGREVGKVGGTTQREMDRARSQVKRTSRAYEAQKNAVLDAKRQMGLSVNDVIGAEGRLRSAIEKTTEAIWKQEEAERRTAQLNRSRMDRIRQRRDIIGNAAAVAGMYVGYRARETGREAVVQAADFDIAVRKQRAFTGVSEDEQNSLLLPQAKRIAQATQFTNIDLVEAQTRTLQGLPMNLPRAKVAEAITEQAKNYALALGTDMTTAAEAIRGYLASTGKDISTEAAAVREATRATNMMIRAAKLGGMDDEDVRQFAKYGAASSTVAGFSDITRMAIGAGMRRAGVRGDEAGVFLRSVSSKMVAPTPKGLAALYTAGINYNDYTKMPGGLSADALENKFRMDFGKSFTPEIREQVKEVLADEDMINDRGAFTEAVTEAVSELFPKKKNGEMLASDRNKLAKKIGDFHKLSVESVDVEGLLLAIMKKDPSLAVLNAFFTDRQGGRAAILSKGMENFLSDREALKNTPDNFGEHIATEIMAGLGGTLEQFRGSVENATLSIGQANEGLIKLALEGTGSVLDGFSNLSDGAKRAATAVGAAAAGWFAIRGAGKLLTAFFGGGGASVALTGSAAALTGSAEALTLAAARLGTAGSVGAVGNGIGAGTAAAGGAAAGGLWKWILGVAGPIAAGLIVKDGLDAADPNGNLWGATSGIDAWVEKNLGFNPSKVNTTPDPNSRYIPGVGLIAVPQPAGPVSEAPATPQSDPVMARRRSFERAGAPVDPEASRAAGKEAGDAFKAGMDESLDQLLAKGQAVAAQLKAAFSFTATPRIATPNAPASARGVQADTGLGVE